VLQAEKLLRWVSCCGTLHSFAHNVRASQHRYRLKTPPNRLPSGLRFFPDCSHCDPATTLRNSERTLILRTLEAVGWVIGGPKGAGAKLGLKSTEDVPSHLSNPPIR